MSDCESDIVPFNNERKIESSHKRTTSTGKRKTPTKSAIISKKNKTDIFGLRHERNDECDGSSTPVLSTFFVTRLANGNERRTANTSGEYYIDLKVYQTNDARETDSQELWRKALLRLKLQTDGDTIQWRKLQAFVQSADELFMKPPTFYSSNA
ncbi:uncharacterized protein LOC113501078 [Trichoplusia ni]|uniref:Uncharacterized protein LOC113501078 n=1 Tax=Trichoplusia ni TaxID=7111 RepID=A0A7E5WB45_TRINI|nr:uncharacterized protein LOC113501078 [Trichoplusia ni]